jgi:hypothetical protein
MALDLAGVAGAMVRVCTSDPASGEYGKFTAVSVAEFEDIPLPPTPTFQWNGCTVNVSWDDTSTYEQGYRVYIDDMLFSETGPLNGGVGTVSIPTDKLDPGRRYKISVVAFGPGGSSSARGGIRNDRRTSFSHKLAAIRFG